MEDNLPQCQSVNQELKNLMNPPMIEYLKSKTFNNSILCAALYIFLYFSMFKNILFQFEMDVMVSLTRMCAPVPNVEQV